MKSEQSAPLTGISKGKPVIVSSKKEPKPERGSAFRQVLAAFIANIGTVNVGLVFGFSAVALPQLRAENSSIPIDDDQASWVASLSSMTMPIGCVLGGFLMDAIGRKYTLIVTEIPIVIGWLLIACADSVPMIYAGRLLSGFGTGIVTAPARVYTGEVTQPHLRGMLTAVSCVFVSIGVMIVYSIGALVQWETLAFICASIPSFALVSMLFFPETPNHLVCQEKTDEARKSLKQLRGSTCDIEAELDFLVNFAVVNNCHKPKGFKETARALSDRKNLKPLGMLVIYFVFYQFSGINSITFYSVEIFQDSGTEMNKYLATVILGAVRLIATIVACVALRKCGRRPLTMISGIGCSSTMLGLGTYLYFSSQWKAANEPLQYTWIPLFCMFTFIICCSMGFLVVPWVMIGEIYPVRVRGILGGLTTCSTHIAVFVVVKTYPYLYQHIGKSGAFWMYGTITILGSIYCYYYIPETKGKTLQDIEDYFAGRANTLSPKRRNPEILQAGKGSALP